MLRILALTVVLTGCIDWNKINPISKPNASLQTLGGSGDSIAAKDCVGAFPNSSVGSFKIRTNFPFDPDCSYIFQYPDEDVAIGVLETLGREQIVWFRFKEGLPKDGTYSIEEGFSEDKTIAASVDHAELNLHKEYPKGDPVQGDVSIKRAGKQLILTLSLTSTVPLKVASSLKVSGEITVPNTIEAATRLSH